MHKECQHKKKGCSNDEKERDSVGLGWVCNYMVA